MDMFVPKKPVRAENGLRSLFCFRSARQAFRAYLEATGFSQHGKVLLPAYVGWSSREGSGVFDPVRESGANWSFYPVGEDLSVDLGALPNLISGDDPCLLVIIHYFGYPSAGSSRAARLVHDRGGLVLEDQAHSLLSDWIGGVTGRLGDASVFSFHKLFPVEWGGGLSLSNIGTETLRERLSTSPLRTELPFDPLSYDLKRISEAQRANAVELARRLEPLSDHLRPLFPALPKTRGAADISSSRTQA